MDDEQSTVPLMRFDTSSLEEASFVLEVLEGPATGAEVTVDGSAVALVGSGPACTVRIADRHVSRRHVALEVSGRRMRVTDLGSANGTFLDGTQIEVAHARGGEVLRIGESAFRIRAAGAPVRSFLSVDTAFGDVVGASAEMRRMYPLFLRVAQSNVPVVIEGETGTGKEALAEALHQAGPRAQKPFIVFDCTAVPGNLLESELFGHERGAFTGAVSQRKGVFEAAHGGSLLIDEIGDLDLQLQPKLLRAVERSEIRRVGGTQTIKVDVRIMAATRRDLDREVHAGRFRDDLFHRLAVARVELPPLRRRRGDIAVLASHFVRTLGGRDGALPSDLLRKWEDDPWPGNVRELRNTVARHLALGDLARIQEAASAAHVEGADGGFAPGRDPGEGGDVTADTLARDLPLTEARERIVHEFERRYVERLLEKHGGNATRAAAAAGIGVRYLNMLRARSRRG